MIRRAFLLSMLVVPAMFAVDSSLLSLVPADAKVTGGIQVSRTVNSPFGQYVLNQMGQSNKDLQDFINATGFDPRRDVQEIVFASTGEPKAPGLVLARGVFNGPQILSAIRAKEPTMTQIAYRGLQLLEKNGHSIAIADGWLGIAGDSAMVRAAIDRRSASGFASPVVIKASTVGAKYDAWMVTNGVFVAPLPGKNGNSNPMTGGLQGIVETSGGLTFGSTVQFAGEAVTRSDKDAQALVDVVKFISGMVQMNTNNPDMQKLQPLLDSLQVSAQGTTVKMSFSIPEAELEQMMKPHARGPRTAVNRQ
ncbi:MAG: hypothetical protein SGI92_21325 [Bryobacteraceae bacterium]|nr:hypothetical protein [Bryobacteraceae bacterium]